MPNWAMKVPIGIKNPFVELAVSLRSTLALFNAQRLALSTHGHAAEKPLACGFIAWTKPNHDSAKGGVPFKRLHGSAFFRGLDSGGT